ncbi:sialate O-acetylesterase [Stieleria sp.]|uniref:sialate O-acetylesterase n=1 Tax=Stieleria sp. TaxID=2795976 RepID=UPI003567FD71
MSLLRLAASVLLPLVAFFGAHSHAAETDGKHLFILSGQSNMQGHRPDEAFTPAVKEALGEDNVIVVQDALGGQPIQRWFKDWKAPDGSQPKTTGDLYDRLMGKVTPAIEGVDLASVTFIWMQGERDAKMKWGDVYQASLVGLYRQLSQDLGRDDVNFVIGRLSDFDLDNKKYPHWTRVRDIQVSVAESNSRFAWIDTDDLNDGKNRSGKSIQNDLHYSGEGYKTLGKRFAENAVRLIRENE